MSAARAVVAALAAAASVAAAAPAGCDPGAGTTGQHHPAHRTDPGELDLSQTPADQAKLRDEIHRTAHGPGCEVIDESKIVVSRDARGGVLISTDPDNCVGGAG